MYTVKSNFHMSDLFHFFNYFLGPKTVKSPLTSSHVSCSIFLLFFFKPSVSSRVKVLKGKLGILNLT